MIALSGCAKRNADRELARLLALVERHVQGAKSACAIEALRALASDAAALEHRKHPETAPDVGAAGRLSRAEPTSR